MKKFKYPLAIEGTKEQFGVLIPKLEDLGYKKSNGVFNLNDDYLTTSESGIAGTLSTYNIDFILNPGFVTFVSASNPELVLALAAMADDDKPYIGECWDYEGAIKKIYEIRLCDNWFRSNDDFYTTGSWLTEKNWFNPFYSSCNKATKEEIINHFTMKEEKKIIGYKVITHLLAYCYGTIVVQVNEGQYAPKGTTAGGICFPSHLMENNDFFGPVYEEKPEVKIITLKCDGGTFEIEVSEKGIYHRPEDKWLDYFQLLTVIRQSVTAVSGYSFKPVVTHIDSGCKKNVPISDWRKVLDYYGNNFLPF